MKVHWKVFSTIFFVLSLYFILKDRSIEKLSLVILTLVIHELGHYLTMKHYRYKDVKPILIPFFGAAVVGHRPEGIRRYQEALSYLAGPLPGILIGAGLLVAHHYSKADILLDAGA